MKADTTIETKLGTFDRDHITLNKFTKAILKHCNVN